MQAQFPIPLRPRGETRILIFLDTRPSLAGLTLGAPIHLEPLCLGRGLLSPPSGSWGSPTCRSEATLFRPEESPVPQTLGETL